MDLLAPLLLDAMLAPAPHTRCCSASAASRPTLQEAADGWLITALVPGMDASQVSVETLKEEDGSNHVWLHALPRLKTELRLPSNADAARCSASLLNGVLTVAVPKKEKETHAVAVDASPLPDGLTEPRAQVALALPGLAAADLSVTITRERSLQLHIKGCSAAFGDVHEVLRLPDRAVAAQARASMVNGVFSFSVPIAPEPAAAVPVLASSADASAEAAEKDSKLLLLEAAAPGLCAADFSASVSGRTLTLSANNSALGGFLMRRSVLLPPHTQPAAVVITCVNGLLRVVAPRPQPPARTAVQVSATTTATLMIKEGPCTPPASPIAHAEAPMEEEEAAAQQ